MERIVMLILATISKQPSLSKYSYTGVAKSRKNIYTRRAAPLRWGRKKNSNLQSLVKFTAEGMETRNGRELGFGTNRTF